MSIFGPRDDSTNDPHAWIFKDRKTKGVNGGIFTSGAWRTRDLNTSCGNKGTSVTLANNRITLQPGTYHLRGSAPAMCVHNHQTRIWNATRQTTVFTGSSEYADLVNVTTRSVFECNITVAGPGADDIEIQHQCHTTRNHDGFGVAGGYGDEVYTLVTVVKVA